MKNSISWIALTIAIVSLTITLLHILHFAPNNIFDNCNYIDIIGILVGSAALVFSLFFVILGIRGHQIQNEIESANKEFEATVEKTLIKPATQVSKLYYDLYSESIGLLTTIHNNLPNQTIQQKDYLDELKLAQARLACNVDFFVDKEKTLMSINLLKEKSKNEIDMDLMDMVIANPKSDKDIKKAARKAYRAIEKRINQRI